MAIEIEVTAVNVSARSQTVRGSVRQVVVLEFPDTALSDFVDQLGAEALLGEIGRRKAMDYFDLSE